MNAPHAIVTGVPTSSADALGIGVGEAAVDCEGDGESVPSGIGTRSGAHALREIREAEKSRAATATRDVVGPIPAIVR
jgi:hypothetical protein